MGLRDIVIFGLIFGSLPFILWRPYIGVLVWSWLAYMSPHRLTWSAAFDFRFSVVVGAVLLVSVAVSREPKRMIWTPLTIIWVLFFFWTWLTTQFAFFPEDAALEWSRWWKINLTSFITLLVMQSRQRLHLLVWVIALSLAFYGVKGGVFGILTGGANMVYGPEGSFIGDNTSIGLALIMALPLVRYAQLEATRKWVRLALTATMILTAVAILATQSRGALLGILGMVAFLVMKSPSRLRAMLLVAVLAPTLFFFMPSSWHEKMGTISSYEEDGSALGRINAWWFAFNLAKDRPIVGGGFRTFDETLFQKYAPNPEDVHDAHSIYFEIMAEQGFIGFFLFMTLGILAFFTARWTIKQARARPDLSWAVNMAAMIQVSLVGYAIAGAFLGLAYFDLVYHLLAILVVLRHLVAQALSQGSYVPAQPVVRAPMPIPSPSRVPVSRKAAP